MSAILGSAKALVPVLFAAAIAALEQLGVSIDWVTATLTNAAKVCRA